MQGKGGIPPGRWAANGGVVQRPGLRRAGGCRQLRTRRLAAGIGKQAVDSCVGGGRMKRTNSSAGGDEDVKAMTIAGDAVESLAQQAADAEDVEMGKQYGLDPSKVREFREVFQIVDQDGSGQIGKEEVTSLLKMLGAPKSDEEVEAMVKEVDADGSGEIDFGEFLVVMTARPSVTFLEKQLMDAFHLYADSANFKNRKEPGFTPVPKGYIRPDDLQNMLLEYLGKLGLTDEDEVTELVASLPINKEGNVYYSEFVRSFFSIGQ